MFLNQQTYDLRLLLGVDLVPILIPKAVVHTLQCAATLHIDACST